MDRDDVRRTLATGEVSIRFDGFHEPAQIEAFVRTNFAPLLAARVLRELRRPENAVATAPDVRIAVRRWEPAAADSVRPLAALALDLLVLIGRAALRRPSGER